MEGKFTRVRLRWDVSRRSPNLDPVQGYLVLEIFSILVQDQCQSTLIRRLLCVFEINRVKYKESRATKQTRIAETGHTRKVIFGESQPPDVTT